MESHSSSSDPLTAGHDSYPSENNTSFRIPTQSIKQQVVTRDGPKCWLCECDFGTLLDVAYNINASINLDKLNSWKESGWIPSTLYPGGADNLICLCKNCYASYNSQYPDWILLPRNMEFFIEFEKVDYLKRVAAAEQGIKQPRSIPKVKIGSPETLCQPYILFSKFINNTRFASERFPCQYSGCLQTLIIKSFAGCIYPYPHNTVRDSNGREFTLGIPDEVVDQVRELTRLWSRLDPDVAPTVGKTKRKRSPSEDDRNENNDSKSSEEQPETPRFSKSTRSRRRVNPSKSFQNIEPTDEDLWAWGPETTASGIMSIVQEWKQIRDDHDAFVMEKKEKRKLDKQKREEHRTA